MYELPYRLPYIENKRLRDPHVVILGAGASIAACKIDKNGLRVPVLANIHKVLGLTNMLQTYGFSSEEMENFELLFSNINGKSEYAKLQRVLESKVRDYFKCLEIPDEPTIYDYLVLSLTEKDAIISFNWDPFLMQAYKRNLSVENLPQLIFPHGNVGVGLCYDCKVKGYANCLCPQCFKKLSDMKLLFPVHKKNYYDGEIIQNEWTVAKKYLSIAAGITVFGYGAPETDVEAYNLLKDSYKASNITTIAPFSIINLKIAEEEQRKKWSDIYDKHMVTFHETFQDSLLWQAPRVSLETLFDAILQQRPRANTKSFQEFETLRELQSFVKTITEYDMTI
ncbi:hypothetical protein [Enterocloster clostridioformis]|uniref:hypothetical protein n=1 Tax=Enterocloster clostridioformis TaxID=1531 RepID=UPI0008E16DAF|nr:hypothetical protein [Enterocloster clostridioformis]SFG47096.1 hypothetical protein SAMN05660211_03007 [Enterocloster clostridioformis]